VQKWLAGDVPLNVNFASSKPLFGAGAVSISVTQLIYITTEFNIARYRLNIVSIFDKLFWPITSRKVTPDQHRFKGEWFFRGNISRSGIPNLALQRRFCRHENGHKNITQVGTFWACLTFSASTFARHVYTALSSHDVRPSGLLCCLPNGLEHTPDNLRDPALPPNTSTLRAGLKLCCCHLTSVLEALRLCAI